MSSAGLDMVYNENPIPALPAVVSDWAPYAQALMTADHGKPPDAIYEALGGAQAFGLASALLQAGYKGIIEHSTYAPSVTATAKGEYAENTFATVETAPTNPGMRKIIAALNAQGVTSIGQPELSAYFSAEMFIQILEKVGPNLTPERFRQVASTFTFSIPHIVGPSSYPAGFQVGAPCGEIVYSNGVKWTVASPYECSGTDLKKGSNGQYSLVKYPSDIQS
jgi:hypothetical protein